MALSLCPTDQPPNSTNLEPTGCQFEHDSGSKCGLRKIHARSYCERHYKQLERSGVFRELRQADHIDTLVSANADKLLQAKSILEKSAPYAARLMIKASKVAAERGDHKPARDVLILSKAVEEPNKAASFASQSGVTIKVGVALAGLDQASTAIRIDNSSNSPELEIRADDIADGTASVDKLEEH